VEFCATGSPNRDFLRVDDLADAALFLMLNYDSPEIINVGTGEDLTIRDLALLIKKCVGYEGELKFNTDKPDGTPRKLLDVSRINKLGWRARIGLEEGIRAVCAEYAEQRKLSDVEAG